MKKLYPLDAYVTDFDEEFILHINKIIMNQNEIIEWISQFQDRIKLMKIIDEKIKKGGKS